MTRPRETESVRMENDVSGSEIVQTTKGNDFAAVKEVGNPEGWIQWYGADLSDVEL